MKLWKVITACVGTVLTISLAILALVGITWYKEEIERGTIYNIPKQS